MGGCSGLVWHRLGSGLWALGSVVCGLWSVAPWALGLFVGLWWACLWSGLARALVGSVGLSMGLCGLWALVGLHWTLGLAAVSAHFVFTCKKTRIESGRL